MNSNNSLRNYKHDISGKFKDISSALSGMDEASFQDPANNEVFHAIHEVLLKMIKTSRNTIAENLNQSMTLVVTDGEANSELAKLQIQGVTVRYVLTADKVTYFLFLQENKGNPAFLLGKIYSVLPVKKIRNEITNCDLRESIEGLV